MTVLEVVPIGLHVLVDDVWGDGADLDEAVVLDEDGVAGQVAMGDGGAAGLVQVAEGRQDLRAPPLPRLKLDLPVVLLRPPQELLQGPG